MFNTLAVTTIRESGPSSAVSLSIALCVILLTAFVVAGTWKAYQKAGKPGWASILPVYSTWVLFEITGYPAWISLLGIIPLVGLGSGVFYIMAMFKLAKMFGKGTAFAVLNILLPFITMPLLGFGDAKLEIKTTSDTEASPETASEPKEHVEEPDSDIPTDKPPTTTAD